MTDQTSGEAYRDAAIRWVVLMHSDQVTRDDERRFALWLEADPAHGSAYAEQNALWRDVGDLARDAGNLAAFATLRAEPVHTARRRFMAAGVAALVTTSGAGWLGWRAFIQGKTFSTQTGEQRREVLADGSAITLDTDTILRVDINDGERRLWLDKGRAYFAVAKDVARPFRVFVGRDEVRALGTEFDIRRDSGHARVTLEEGAVAIFRAADQHVLRADRRSLRPAAVLQPGEQAVLLPSETVPEIHTVALGIASAWRTGQMVLDHERLADAVDEINRYNKRKIVLGDDMVGAIELNGAFQLSHPEIFVDVLTSTFPVRVAHADDDAIYLVSAAAPSDRL